MKKLLLVVMAAGLLIAADKPKDNADSKAQDKLQGTWKVKSMERGGKTVEATGDRPAPKSLTIKGKDITVEMAGGEEHQGTIKLGKEGKFNTIDLMPKDGGGDQPVKGLYQVEGDKLKICVHFDNLSERPKELGSKEGDGRTVITFEREKR